MCLPMHTGNLIQKENPFPSFPKLYETKTCTRTHALTYTMCKRKKVREANNARKKKQRRGDLKWERKIQKERETIEWWYMERRKWKMSARTRVKIYRLAFDGALLAVCIYFSFISWEKSSKRKGMDIVLSRFTTLKATFIVLVYSCSRSLLFSPKIYPVFSWLNFFVATSFFIYMLVYCE